VQAVKHGEIVQWYVSTFVDLPAALKGQALQKFVDGANDTEKRRNAQKLEFLVSPELIDVWGARPKGTSFKVIAHQLVSEPKFKVGQKYWSSGKHPRLCTVTDIWLTYNATGELVKTRYVATHEFLGQTVTDSDIVETTIARSLSVRPVQTKEGS
jgi:hypothetical protein